MDYIIIGIIILISFFISLVITKIEIPVLKKRRGQNIREDGPESHLSKAGTPSMGGISIIIAAAVTSAAATGILRNGSEPETVIIIVVFVGFRTDRVYR